MQLVIKNESIRYKTIFIKHKNIRTKHNSVAKTNIVLCFFISVTFSLVFTFLEIYPFDNVFTFYTAFYAVYYWILNNVSEYGSNVFFYLGLIVDTFILSLFLVDYAQIKLEAVEIELVEANNELSLQKIREEKTNLILTDAKVRLNIMKDHLFWIISLDLRSAITTIHGLTDMLVTGKLKEDERQVISE